MNLSEVLTMIKVKDVVLNKFFFVADDKVDVFFDEYNHPEDLIIVEV